MMLIRLSLYLLLCVVSWHGVADAATRYVDGNISPSSCGTYSIASRNCSGSDGNAYKTVDGGLAALSAGDILYIRAGNYTISGSYLGPYGGGASSWETATQIKNYPSEAVTVNTATMNFDSLSYNMSYIIFEGDLRSNFVFDGASAGGDFDGFRLVNQANHLRFQSMTVQNYTSNGFSARGCSSSANTPSDIQIIDVLVYNNGDSSSGDRQEHGLYAGCAKNWLIEKSHFRQNFSFGMTFWAGSGFYFDNIILRHNVVEGRKSTSATGMAIQVLGTNVQIYRNLIIGQGTASGKLSTCVTVYAPSTNQQVTNNTCYDVTNGVHVEYFPTGTTIRNNIFNTISGSVFNAPDSSSYTASSNLCPTLISGCSLSGSPGFTTPGTDFSLASGSQSINGCTDVGLPYNGSAPDCGAFETFVFASCAVESGTTSVVNITFENNVYPPLQITDTTGLSARENAASKTNSSAAINGTNQVDLAVTAAFSSGTSIDISASGTNITDSALIGGTDNQPYIQTLTNQACANNISGVGYTWTQSRFGMYALRGTESGASKLPTSGSADNTNKTVAVGHSIGLRIKLNCTGGDCPADGFILRYKRNGGTTTTVPDTFGADNIAYYTANDPNVVSQGTSTTERLTSDHATNVAGLVVRSANAIPSLDFSENSESELLYFLRWDTDATAGDVYTFFLERQGGQTITISQTPTITLVPVSAGGGP